MGLLCPGISAINITMKSLILNIFLAGTLLFAASCEKEHQTFENSNVTEQTVGKDNYNVSAIQGGDEDDPQPIFGNVKGAQNAALSGATIKLLEAGTSTLVQQTTTNSSGEFTLDDVAQETYDVEFSASGYFTQTQYNVTVSNSPVDLGTTTLQIQ